MTVRTRTVRRASVAAELRHGHRAGTLVVEDAGSHRLKRTRMDRVIGWLCASAVLMPAPAVLCAGAESRAGISGAPLQIGPLSQVEPGLMDLAYIGLLSAGGVALRVQDEPPPNLGMSPGAFDLGVRDGLRVQTGGPTAKASDVLMISLVAGALSAPALVHWSVGPAERRAAMVGAEGLLTTALVTGLPKYSVRRQRPDGYAADQYAGSRSFFSGHTASAFGSATLVSLYAYEFQWLSEDLRWLVPASSYSLAAATGYLRVAADKHWATDVCVGAAVGTLTSWLVYKLRTDWLVSN